MSIPKGREKINRTSLFLVLGVGCAIFVAVVGSFYLKNELSGHGAVNIATSILYPPIIPGSMAPQFALVGSKTGKKYYASTCAAAKRIKPEKLITFENREAAEAQRYTPAANCPDLEVEK